MRGKLQIRYSVHGQKYHETLDLKQNEAGVRDAVRIRKKKIEEARYGAAQTDSATFKEMAQAYLDQYGGAASTRTLYRQHLEIYWSALARREVGTISRQDVLALDDSILWPSEKTRNNALTPLKGVFDHALSRGYVDHNPAHSLRARKREMPVVDPYTAEERDALLSALAETPAQFYFQVAFGTGARTGELLALSWDDYDGDSLWVERARVRKKLKGTKTGKSRRVLLLPETVAVIEAQPRPIQGGPMFQTQYGKGYQSGTELNQFFRHAHAATGVRLRVDRTGKPAKYPWRHTYASLALAAGVRPSLIAAQLGHRLDVLLSTYAKYIPRDDDAAELAKMTKSGAEVAQDA